MNAFEITTDPASIREALAVLRRGGSITASDTTLAIAVVRHVRGMKPDRTDPDSERIMELVAAAEREVQ